MNPTAIFSKSGKGVQEASGKTSSLSRGDRAVLSAIDGRATLGDVAGKVGKQFDNEFKSLITKLDKDGFIREVSPGAAGAAPKGGGAPAKPAASKPTAPMDVASDLDFTAAMAVPKKSGPAAPPPQTVARAPAPPPKPTVAVPPKPPPPSAAEQVKQAQIAKDQQSAFAKAREEAERKQQEDRDRLKSEAEAKVRAETESKLRAEAEEKAKADAEAKAKKAEAEAATARSAAIRAAAEAKVKAEAEAKRAREEAERAKREAEAEAKRAREEAERAKREAEEKAARARQEAEEKARREQEELKRKLEEERRAREEAERKAKEEAERARRELEEERRKMEEERKQREEETRREEEERAARRKREDEEEQLRRALKEEQEETERTARRKQREEEEEREREEKEAKRKRESEPSLEDLMAAQSAPPAAPPPAAKKAATGDAFADSLLADLDSFTQRDDEDRKAKEESDRKGKEEVARRKQEEAERQEREAAEGRQREEDARRRKEEEKQRARDEEERRVRKVQEEQEQAERETEERRRKIAAASGAAAAPTDDIGITDDDLQMDEVKKEAALLEKKKDRKAEREKEREKERAQKKERDREAKSKKEKEKEEKEAKKSAAAYSPRRRKSNLGRNLVLGVLLLAIIGVGALHVMPVSTDEYETAATEAIGRPVKIGAGRFSLIGGVQYKFDNVSVGGLAIPTVRAFPELGSLLGDKKVFTRLELDGMTLPQDAIAEVLFGKARSDRFHIERVVAKNLKLAGALPLPALEVDVQLEGGGMRTATLRGGEGLVAKLSAKESSIDFDVGTSQFTLPFAPEITLVQFAMKGEATRQGMKVSAWDGLLYSGHMTGTATVRWGNTWTIEGVVTARGVNAAVFAPALVSNGRGEGTGRFSMSGVEPAKLGSTGRLEGNFMVTKGVLGSFDLSRALQTGGRQVTGQTQFAEMSGQAVYDRGALSLRNINLSAGALNAGASADISESGALSGRIIADVKTSAQNLRATLVMGGTVKEPQVK